MTVLSTIKGVLEADAPLLTAATGGVYDFDETGRSGINRATTPGAFDSNELVKPCVLVKARDTVADNALRDDPSQYASVRTVIEVWFYDDEGYSSIETMRDRVYALLAGKQFSGTFKVTWMQDIRQGRDEDLDASMERSDYDVRHSKSV